MDLSADEIDKEELRNIYQSTKKFIIRYVFLVSVSTIVLVTFNYMYIYTMCLDGLADWRLVCFL